MTLDQPTTGGDARLPGLSVFLPSHNEEGNVERVVGAFLNELPAVAKNYEVIVVDDGSADLTGAIADRLAAQDSHVKVVHHATNRGYGAAVISGIRASTMPFVLLCDGDGQFDPRDMRLLTGAIAAQDVVIGHRVNRADPLMRRLNGRAWTVLMRLLFGIRVSDVDCGFKMFRRDTLDGLEFRAQGAMISTELLARAANRGARIAEVEVRHLPRTTGQSSGAKLRVIFRAFAELFRLFGELRRS